MTSRLLPVNLVFLNRRAWINFRIHCTKAPSGDRTIKAGDVCYIQSECPKDGKVNASDTGHPVAIEQIFKRPVRGEPGKVRLGFIPDEWFKFFYVKTGVTGPYAFFITVPTYLISKEIYVMEHEYYSGLSVFASIWLAKHYLGASIAKSLDAQVDAVEKSWNDLRNNEKQFYEDVINDEKKSQDSADGQFMLMNAKRENVGLQLERAYRIRLLGAYTEVKKRLDFQVAKAEIERRFMHRNLVMWVVDQVKTAYTEEKAKENIDVCINHLAELAAKYKL